MQSHSVLRVTAPSGVQFRVVPDPAADFLGDAVQAIPENCYIILYKLIWCRLNDLKANILFMSRSTNSIFALPEESRSALKNLGLRLRAQRLAQNMTVEQLAERLLCSPTTYRALESGKPTVSLGMLVHALWLFGKTDELDKLFPLEIGMLGNKRSQRARPVTMGISDDERDF